MQPILIRCGGYQPPASIHNRAAQVLGNGLAARLGEAALRHANLGERSTAILEALVTTVGETASLAVIAGQIGRAHV